MLTLTLIGAALAQSPAEEILSKLDGDATPTLAVSCQPIGDLARVARGLRGSLQMIVDTQEESDKDTARFMMSLTEPGALEAAGFDPQGALTSMVWFDTLRGESPDDGFNTNSVSFAGTAQQAEALLGQFSSPAAISAEPDGTSWIVRDPEDRPQKVRLENQVLHFEHGTVQELSNGADPRLLTGLEGQPGCMVYAFQKGGLLPDGKKLPLFKNKDPEKASDFKLSGFSLFIPTREHDLRFRVVTTISLPSALNQGAVVPAIGSSTMEPLLVGVLSADPAELGRQVVDILPDTFPQIEKIRAALDQPLPVQIPPGTTFALFQHADGMKGAVAIPVLTKKGKPVPAKKLLKGMKAAIVAEGKWEMKPEAEEGGFYTTRNLEKGKKEKIHFRAIKGLVIIGTDAKVVDETVSGQGKPWASERLIARAATWPMSLEGRPPLPPHAPPVVFQLGLRADGHLVEVGMDLNVAGMTSSGEALVTMIGNLAVPNFIEMQNRAKRAEVPSNVDGIKTALIAYDAMYDTYLPAEATPRPVTELNGKQVEWMAGSAFDKLGWHPDGKVRGTYWVEITEDGTNFKVYGAIDIDGDGVPAIYTATKEYNTTMETPPTVF